MYLRDIKLYLFLSTLFTTGFLGLGPLWADEFVLISENAEEKEDLSKKERFIHWLHNLHSPKHLGIDDPHLPSFVKFKPLMIPLPGCYKLPKEFFIRDDSLDMRSLTPQSLEKLQVSELKMLLDYLATVPIEIKWSDKEGHTHSGNKRKHRAHYLSRWDESNAAAALALTMATQSQHELFITLVALAPEAILPEFRGHVPGLINADLNAQIMGNMLTQPNHFNAARIARIVCHLTQQGLKYWVGKDMSKLTPYLSEMLAETTKIIDSAYLESKEAILGLLLGSVLSGALKHLDAIKRTDERRIWIVGIISNFVWAATSFIGCVPIAAPIAAAAAGGISAGAVLSAALYTALEFPRNYESNAKEIEGNLEIAALALTLQKDIDIKIDILMMLNWMRAAIHVNGFSD